MLKAFVVSDLHGVLSEEMRRAVCDEEPDVVLCCGDVTPFRLREEYFEHVHGSDEALWDVVGKRRYKAETVKDIADAHHVLAGLDDLPFPVRFVPGNNDHVRWSHELREDDPVEVEWGWPQQDFLEGFLSDIGVKDVSYGADIIGDYVVIGYPFSSSPGHVQSDVYRRHRAWLDNCFKVFEQKRHADKNVIFLCHNGPYNVATDVITSDEAPESVQGEHYGSKLARRIIDRYQPKVCVHGHIDEGRGEDVLGETRVVNVGSGKHGMYGVIEIRREGLQVRLEEA